MTVESFCESCDGTLRIKVAGPPDVDAIIEIIDECFEKFSFTDVLWDLRESSLSGLTFDAFHAVADACSKFDDKRGPGARTLMLVKNGADELLCRAYAANVATASSAEYLVSTSEEIIESWLDDGERPTLARK